MKEIFMEQLEKEQNEDNHSVKDNSTYYSISTQVNQLDKVGIEAICNKILDNLNIEDASSLYAKCDFIIKALTKAKENLREQALEELQKESGELTRLEATLKQKETATKYDFSHYKKWVEKNNELLKIEKDMKMALMSNHSIVDENGEVIPKAIKKSTTSIEIKYK